MFSQSIILSLALGTLAAPFDFVKRQSCPQIHVFGARETTASPGYGSAGSVVQAILNSHSGATAEASSDKRSLHEQSGVLTIRAGNRLPSLWLESHVLSVSRSCQSEKIEAETWTFQIGSGRQRSCGEPG